MIIGKVFEFNCIILPAGAIKLLGEPIKQLGFDMSDKENFIQGRSCQYHVRVKGPNDKGMKK